MEVFSQFRHIPLSGGYPTSGYTTMCKSTPGLGISVHLKTVQHYHSETFTESAKLGRVSSLKIATNQLAESFHLHLL